MLAGIGVLALATIIVAIWAARISSRAQRTAAQVDLLEKRLAHVEDYLSKTSARKVVAAADPDDDEEAEVPVMGAGGARRRATSGQVAGGMVSASPAAAATAASGASGKQTKQARRSKREMVVPSGAAKPEPDARASSRPSVRPQAPTGQDRLATRQSMSHDARRRREERHQAQMRRQAEAIVQEHYGRGSADNEDL